MVIKAKPIAERPRERCLHFGAASLSVRECLALILGSGPRGKGCLGLAEDILARFGGRPEGDGSEAEEPFFAAVQAGAASWLGGITGLGVSGQTRLLAAFELMQRFHHYVIRTNDPQPTSTSTLKHLEQLALTKVSDKLRAATREWLGFIPYDCRRGMGSLSIVEHGSRTHVNVDLQELFTRILMQRPQAIFLVHNHPNSDPSPSSDDLQLTQTVDSIAEPFGIQLLSHLIVTPSGAAAFSTTATGDFRACPT